MSNNSNFFEEVLNDAKGVGTQFTGEDYPYYKYIKAPSQIGMSGKGTIQQLGQDIDGLVNYVELLVTGKSKASATGQPLGNKFFLKTGGKCVSKVDGTDQDRYIYINNVPVGNIPFISQGLGVNFSEFKGLIPGTISNLNAFNPVTMFQSFLSGSKPDCQEITMETIDTYNMKSTETHFVTLVDIKNTDPCLFPNKVNPVTGAKCVETFANINTSSETDDYLLLKVPNDPIIQAYFASLGALSIYVLYKIMIKNGMIPK
jgi:hypothetical protein